MAQSIQSDLAIVKPVAMKMFNIKGEHSEKYFKEVEHKLVEETNYVLELAQSQEVTASCGHIPNLRFPTYSAQVAFDRALEKALQTDIANGNNNAKTALHAAGVKVQIAKPVLATALGLAVVDFLPRKCLARAKRSMH